MASGNSMYRTNYNGVPIAESTAKILSQASGSGTNVGTAQDAIKASLNAQAEYAPTVQKYINETKSSGGNKASTGTANAGVIAEGNGFDLAAYLAEINAQRQAAADAAYNRAAAALNSAYEKARGSYGNVYDSGVGQLGKTYNNSRGKISDEATDAFRQAHVNRMIGEKNLSQRLAALGISGGLSESSLAGIINSYDKARSNVQNTLDTNLGDLEMKYQGNLSDLYRAYQSQLAALDSNNASQLAQLEMNRANQIASAGGDYFSALMSNANLLNNAMQKAVSSQNAYAPNAQSVSNVNNAVATTQANDMGGTKTNWSAWQNNLLNQLNSGNSNINGAIASLKGQASAEELASFLNSLGIGA